MKNLEKFKSESLELNQLINLKGGETRGGDGSGCWDWEDCIDGYGCWDVRIHEYNDDGSYNGWFEG